jgi:hypothetical protein
VTAPEAFAMSTGKARTIVRHILGQMANIESVRGRYVISLGDAFLAADKDIFVAVRDAVIAHCARTGKNPIDIMSEAIATFQGGRKDT